MSICEVVKIINGGDRGAGKSRVDFLLETADLILIIGWILSQFPILNPPVHQGILLGGSEMGFCGECLKNSPISLG